MQDITAVMVGATMVAGMGMVCRRILTHRSIVQLTSSRRMESVSVLDKVTMVATVDIAVATVDIAVVMVDIAVVMVGTMAVITDTTAVIITKLNGTRRSTLIGNARQDSLAEPANRLRVAESPRS